MNGCPSGVGTLQDDFNSNQLASFWRANDLFSGLTDTAIAVQAINQRLEIGPLSTASGSHYNGVRTDPINLTGGVVSVRLVAPASMATTAFTMLTVGPDGLNHYRFYTSAGNLVCEKKIADVKTHPCQVLYDPTGHQYLRIATTPQLAPSSGKSRPAPVAPQEPGPCSFPNRGTRAPFRRRH